MTIYTAAITLFLIMDPVGNVPIFLSILKGINPKRQNYIILRESFIAFLFLLMFLFSGGWVLETLQVSEQALGIAGGIILFLIALKMIFPVNEDDPKERQQGEPFIVPLAVPLIAGPASLAMVTLFASETPHQKLAWVFAIVLASAASTIVLLSSGFLRNVLGERGLLAMERLMGMILTAIAVQMFLNGINQYFHIN